MNMNKAFSNAARRLLTMLLAFLMPASGMVSIAQASTISTPKQEIVYINLNSGGTVFEVYVVNTFDLSEDGRIVDYGNYTRLRNMTSSEEIAYENETITIDAKAGKLYYEGLLPDSSIPWNFSISYTLDGTRIKAEELGGKSGALQISMSVRENTGCDSPFFENYALQASFTLDTNICKNIIADSATVANIGRKKQLTYTILPGKETDVLISADVTDFEMDGITIGGVPISMNLDVAVENDDDIKQAEDGAVKLDDGADDLNSGSMTGLKS